MAGVVVVDGSSLDVIFRWILSFIGAIFPIGGEPIWVVFFFIRRYYVLCCLLWSDQESMLFGLCFFFRVA